MRRSERLALAQGLYFLISGVWPIVHIRSFERITGPKHEDWLVRTVGLFVTAIGAALTWSVIRRDVDEHTRTIGALGALAPALIDTYEGGRGRISRVYLVDAAVEWLITALWTRTPTGAPLDQAPVARDVRVRADERIEVT
jgi:hypothetical protein